MFELSNLTDKANKSYDRVPDYEPLVTKMWIGIRAKGLFNEPYENNELKSMEGEPLNEELTDIYKISVAQRDSDILNVLRHSDLSFGYNPKGKMAVLAKEKTESLSEENIIEKLKQEIKILISSTEDARGQLNLMHYYKANKHQGKVFLENMLQDLTNGAFVFA